MILPVLPELGQTRNFCLVHVGGRVEDARADAMLVERTIAQIVEHRAGPPTAQQAQRIEAVRDQGNREGLHADQLFIQSLFAAGGLDGLAKRGERHDVATDEAARDQRAQKRAGIIGRNRNLAGRRVARSCPGVLVWHGYDPQMYRITKPNDEIEYALI